MGQLYIKVADDMLFAQNFSACISKNKGILLHSHNADILKRN